MKKDAGYIYFTRVKAAFKISLHLNASLLELAAKASVLAGKSRVSGFRAGNV